MAEADAPAPAAGPGTLQSNPHHFAVIIEDGRVRMVDAAQAKDEPRGDSSLLWIHLHGPDAECQTWLSLQDNIPDTVRPQLTATETRPRCEPIEDGALINLRGPGDAEAGSADPLVSVRMWVQQGRVISVVRRRLAAVDAVYAGLKRGQVTDPGDLVATIATAISTELDDDIAELGDKLDELESTITDEQEETVDRRRDTAKLRSRAISYRRFVAPERDALLRLADLPFDWFDEHDRVDLRNAADRFARMTEELEAVRERSALLHEQLTDLRAEKLEDRNLLVAIIALIFLPLTFITGLFGMNVGGIPYAEHPNGFWIVTIVCIAVALGVTLYFRREHWIGG